MKNKLLLIMSIIFLLIGASYFKTKGNDSYLMMRNGASIRTEGTQGLKFEADFGIDYLNSERGFFIVYGKTTITDLSQALNNNSLIINDKEVKVVDNFDKTSNIISVVLTGIPLRGYNQEITVIAYVKENDNYIFPPTEVTRSVIEVALNAAQNNDIEKITPILNDIETNYFKAGLNDTNNFTIEASIKETNLSNLEKMFIDDWNDLFSLDWTSLEISPLVLSARVGVSSSTNLSGSNIYSFFNNELMQNKWGWFIDYLAINGDVHPKRQANAIKGDGSFSENNGADYNLYKGEHLVMSIYNFFNGSYNYGVDQYYGENFTSTEKQNSVLLLNDKIFIKYSDYYFINKGTSYKLPLLDNFINPVYHDGENIYYAQETLIVNEPLILQVKDTPNDIYVSSTLASLPYRSEVIYDGQSYYYGRNAFSSLSELNSFDLSNKTIYLGSGEYNEDFDINYSNVNIIGPNKDNNPNLSPRESEAIITGTITINKELENINFSGLKFTANAKIINTIGEEGTAALPTTNLDGFVFKNNIVISGASDQTGFIYFSENENSYSHNLSFIGNLFTTDDADLFSVVYLDNLVNLEVYGNTFLNINTNAFYVRDETKGLSGEAYIEANTFENITGSAFKATWISPLPNTVGKIRILYNDFKNVNDHSIYLGKMNNNDIYSEISILYNSFETTGTGIHLARVHAGANIHFNYNVFVDVPINHYIYDEETAASPVILDATKNLYMNDGEIISPLGTKFAGNPNITGQYNSIDNYPSYEFTSLEFRRFKNGVIEVGEDDVLDFLTFPSSINYDINFASQNPLIATITQEGIVSGISEGTVVIEALIGTRVVATINIIVKNRITNNDPIQFIIDANLGTSLMQNVTTYGNTQKTEFVYGAVSKIWFGNLDIIEAIAPIGNSRPGTKLASLEFIVVHDTGNNSKGANGLMHRNYLINSDPGTSWHYVVDSQYVYHQVPNDEVSYHAGDGSRLYGLNNTGVTATSQKPVITISIDGYYEFNGTKSNILAPTNSGIILKTEDITPSGLYTTIGSNGKYYINNTYYNTTYKKIANHGGNRNSIGIESCVDEGSDLYATWQRLAKLVATLLNENDLGLDRVLQHNNMSGKNCPQTLRMANLYDYFMEMVTYEYQLQKVYSDYTFTFTSNNPTIVNNTGKIINKPYSTTEVSYTVRVTGPNNYDESITLYATIPGLKILG